LFFKVKIIETIQQILIFSKPKSLSRLNMKCLFIYFPWYHIR